MFVSCRICLARFVNKRQLDQHISLKHDQREEAIANTPHSSDISSNIENPFETSIDAHDSTNNNNADLQNVARCNDGLVDVSQTPCNDGIVDVSQTETTQGTAEEVITCGMCGQACNSYTGLKHHYKEHNHNASVQVLSNTAVASSITDDSASNNSPTEVCNPLFKITADIPSSVSDNADLLFSASVDCFVDPIDPHVDVNDSIDKSYTVLENFAHYDPCNDGMTRVSHTETTYALSEDVITYGVCGQAFESYAGHEHYKEHNQNRSVEALAITDIESSFPYAAGSNSLPSVVCNPMPRITADIPSYASVNDNLLFSASTDCSAVSNSDYGNLTEPKKIQGSEPGGSNSCSETITLAASPLTVPLEVSNAYNADLATSSSTESESRVNSLIHECSPSTSSYSALVDSESFMPGAVGRNGKRLLPFAIGSREWRDYRNERAKEYRRSRNDIRCPHCSYSAKYPSKLKSHIESAHGNGRYPCRYCNELLDSLLIRRKHESSLHPIYHECEKCGYRNKTKAFVERHVRTHLNDIKCTVSGCNLMLSKYKLRAHLLDEHSSSHSDECAQILPNRISDNGIGCPHCEHIGVSSTDMADHIKRNHTNDIKCPLGCSQRIPLDDLDMHLRTLHAEDQFSFPLPKVLTRRVGKNYDESISCSASSLTPTTTSFGESSLTTGSMADETSSFSKSDDEDVFSVCETLPSSSNKSESSVLGSLPCSYCSKTFKENYRLRKHIVQVHENPSKRKVPKKYQCTFDGCDKSFAVPTLLEDHIRVHQGIAAYRCSHCQRTFAARARFAVHLQKYHSTSIKTYDQLNRALVQNEGAEKSTAGDHSSQTKSGRLTHLLQNMLSGE